MNKDLYIVLQPSCLDSTIDTHILEKAKITYENTSLFDIGYIIRINRLNKILHTFIDKLSSNIIVHGNFNLSFSNPLKGDVVKDCRVHLVMNHGIFLKHYNIDILIPNLQLTDFIYNDSKSFVHKKTKKAIHEDDFLDVVILDRRFRKNEFSCIAKINI